MNISKKFFFIRIVPEAGIISIEFFLSLFSNPVNVGLIIVIFIFFGSYLIVRNKKREIVNSTEKIKSTFFCHDKAKMPEYFFLSNIELKNFAKYWHRQKITIEMTNFVIMMQTKKLQAIGTYIFHLNICEFRLRRPTSFILKCYHQPNFYFLIS